MNLTCSWNFARIKALNHSILFRILFYVIGTMHFNIYSNVLFPVKKQNEKKQSGHLVSVLLLSLPPPSPSLCIMSCMWLKLLYLLKKNSQHASVTFSDSKTDEPIADLLSRWETLINKIHYDTESRISENAREHFGDIKKVLVKIQQTDAKNRQELQSAQFAYARVEKKSEWYKGQVRTCMVNTPRPEEIVIATRMSTVSPALKLSLAV